MLVDIESKGHAPWACFTIVLLSAHLAVTHCGRRETLRGEVQRLLESSQERFRASWSSLPAQKLSRNLHMPGS